MPIEQAGVRGQEHVYDSAAVVAWLIERTVRKIRGESPRDEYLRSQTRLNEIKIAEAEDRLVPVDEILPEFSRMIVEARRRLLQIPVTITDTLEGLDAAARSARIEKAILEALVELSKYDAGLGAPAE